MIGVDPAVSTETFSGPVSTLMSSSAESYSFSLFGRLRAVGISALTSSVTVLYINCTIDHDVYYISATNAKIEETKIRKVERAENQ